MTPLRFWLLFLIRLIWRRLGSLGFFVRRRSLLLLLRQSRSLLCRLLLRSSSFRFLVIEVAPPGAAFFFEWSKSLILLLFFLFVSLLRTRVDACIYLWPRSCGHLKVVLWILSFLLLCVLVRSRLASSCARRRTSGIARRGLGSLQLRPLSSRLCGSRRCAWRGSRRSWPVSSRKLTARSSCPARTSWPPRRLLVFLLAFRRLVLRFVRSRRFGLGPVSQH
ncbi:MAG: hypothetical protein [Microviridae sp.]|nr:MAG: hypothetical protein [Microviridae sp.]